MPTLWAHTNYFATSDTIAPTPLAPSKGGYPLWQATNSAIGSLFGGLQGLWEHLVWWVTTWGKRSEIELALNRLKHPPKPGVIYEYVDRPVIVPSEPRVIEKTVEKVVEQPLSGLLSKVSDLKQHPAYPCALEAVQKTATTLGFNRPEAWQGLSRQMKSSPGRAENVYRHLQACEWTRQTCGSTLSNPDCNLLVELAYHEWANKGQ